MLYLRPKNRGKKLRAGGNHWKSTGNFILIAVWQPWTNIGGKSYCRGQKVFLYFHDKRYSCVWNETVRVFLSAKVILVSDRFTCLSLSSTTSRIARNVMSATFKLLNHCLFHSSWTLLSRFSSWLCTVLVNNQLDSMIFNKCAVGNPNKP